MFIDIHSHILPGLDDGADTLVEACEMISQAAISGTSIIVATPHFNNHNQTHQIIDKNIVLDSYKNLKRVVSEKKLGVNLYLGSELLLDEFFYSSLKKDDLITINGSRYILVEFIFDDIISNAYKYTNKILSMGLIPVIAHPERYDFFTQSFSSVYRFLNDGCIFQINKGSPLGKYGEKAQALSKWLLDNDFCKIIAGDSHSVNFRNANMTQIYEWLIDKYDYSKINALMHDNPKRILLDMKF